MAKFVTILVILFLIIFVIQQSNVIVKTSVMDSRIGVTKDEYHLEWSNLMTYLADIPSKIQSIPENFKKKPGQRERRRLNVD